MPQLWRSNSNRTATPAHKTLQSLICPLSDDSNVNCFAAGSPPSSPTNTHQHPPKYDQLLNELRRAQERRGRLLLQTGQDRSSGQPTSSSSSSSSPPPLPPPLPISKSPLLLADVRRALRSPQPPSGVQINQSVASKTTGPKKVRFLEDGTGNLHTSIFGGSAESIGSLLDSHEELNNSNVDDIDSLISSLIAYSDAPNGAARLNGSANDELRCAEVVDQRQTVVHLEPDDPNSIDSGSVLSELDFEETSSTITDVDSKFSFSSPDHRSVDDWSQVSDLLERSLQEIRQMEEDTNKVLQPAKREPLYELIGWKRNPPPVQLDLKGAKPAPPPPQEPPADVWLPRQDFVPPVVAKEKLWVRQSPVKTNGHQVKPIKDNIPVYGRLWETSSNRSSSSSSEDKPAPTDADLTAIRSMARKARMEHWRLTGMPGTSPVEDESANLSALPLYRVKNGIQVTWPPPPLPPSCSSSAAATPVTPPDQSDQSPKCFGHQRTFQWPVPALKSPPMQRVSESKPWRSIKPSNLEEAQDWYWTEEFPMAAGLEPGTGNMSAWFHGAISRWESERRLANQPTGAFLARLTERLWGYAVSVRSPSGNISHFLVDAGERRSHKKYTLLGSNDPPHKSLRELIQYYGKHALTPDGSEKLLFPCPQESSVSCPSNGPRR